MNWEAIGAIGELVGSVAVVASLVYVAMQLRQHTAMMRTLASQERVQRDFDIASALIDNRDVAEIWVKGRSAFASLSEVDQQRLIWFERRAIIHWNNMFELRNRGQLPETDWDELVWLIRALGRNQGLLATWQIFRGSFGAPFQAFLDDNLQPGAAPGAEQQPGPL